MPTLDSARASAVTAAEARAEPLRIGFAYVGPVGDHGWSYAHDLGRQHVERTFGDAVRVMFVEKVPEAQEGEPIFRDLVALGNELIFGTAFGYMEPMLKVAREHAHVKFEHANGYKTAENLRVFDVRTYEGAYLAGVLAGGLTKTKVIGVVAAIPIPEVIRNINAFALGAQTMNPAVRVRVEWVNSWFDPPLEGAAANKLIDRRADVLMQTTDSTAVLLAAQARGKKAIGWDSDMSGFAPRAHVASAIVDFGPYYVKTVHDVLNGRWTVGSSWWGMKEGAIDIVSVSPAVPPKVLARLEQAKRGLRDGRLNIWSGPLRDQVGRLVYPAGESATDEELGGMNFYVRGVEGVIPK